MKNVDLSNDNKAPVTIKVYFTNHNKARKFINTGIYLREKEWDASANKISTKFGSWRADQRIIDDMVRKIQDREAQFIEQGRIFSPADLDDLLTGTTQKTETFVSFYEKQMNIDNDNGKDVRRKKGTLSIFKKWDTKNTPISAVNYDLIESFDAYLRNKLKLMPNTVSKHHEHLLYTIKVAIRKGLINPNDNPYQDFKFKREKTTKDAITSDELKRLIDLFIPDKTTRLVRDMFVFSCYTGLRFGDVLALNAKNIVTDNNITYIICTMEKTDDQVKLPVSILFEGKALEIIKQYQGFKLDTIFPSITNQEANRQLKSLGMGIGAHVPLTFHVSRHTFGTLLAELTGNPFLIQKLMGHTDIKTSMDYIHLSNYNIAKQLVTVNWRAASFMT